MPPPEPVLPHDLATAWESVQRDWDVGARHAAFIELCAAQGRLADAGALYRRTKELQPARAAVAEQQLQHIMVRAVAMLAAHAPAPTAPRARQVLLLVALVVAGAMMGSALWAATRLLSEGT